MENVAARKKERWRSVQMPRFSRGTAAVSKVGVNRPHSLLLFIQRWSLNELWLQGFDATLVCEESHFLDQTQIHHF